MRRKVQFIEMVRDQGLARKEPAATAAVRRFFPNAPPVKLYRTAEGPVGFFLQLTVTAADRKRLEDAYRAVMRVLGKR